MTETILVLGAGTPCGVGGAIALRFAKAGYHVLVTGRTQEKVEATRTAITAQGGSADAMSCDVTSEQDLDVVFGALAAKEMLVASVIYNAGNNAPVAFETLTAEQPTGVSAALEDFWPLNVRCRFWLARGVAQCCLQVRLLPCAASLTLRTSRLQRAHSETSSRRWHGSTARKAYMWHT